MASLNLTQNEIMLLSYLKDRVDLSSGNLKCDVTIDGLCTDLWLEEETAISILMHLEDLMLITPDDDGAYIISAYAYQLVNRKKAEIDEVSNSAGQKSLKTKNDDIENAYLSQHLKFSDLRINPLNDDKDIEDDILESSDEDYESDKKAEEKEVKEVKEDPKKKTLENLRAQRLLREKLRVEEINKAEPSFLNGDINKDTDTVNAYENAHLMFSDIRGADLSGINADSKEVEDLSEGIQSQEQKLNTENIRPYDENALKNNLSENLFFSSSSVKRLDESEQIPVSSIMEDNMPHIKIETESIDSADIIIITDNTSNGFSSYAEIPAEIPDIPFKENILKSSIEENSRIINVNDLLNENGEHIFNNADENKGSKSGEENEDMQKNHFSTYDFSNLAYELIKDIPKNTYTQTFSGITGDYSSQSGLVAMEMTSTFTALVSSAMASFEKASYNMRIEASNTLEKIKSDERFANFSLSDFNENTREEVTKTLINAGFKPSDINNLYKNRVYAEDELRIRKELSSILYKNPGEIPEELRNYILKKGYKNLSGKSELKLCEVINKGNFNPEIRNINLRKLSAKQLKSLKTKLLSENRLDDKSRLVIEKAILAKKRIRLEQKDIALSLGRVYRKVRPSGQDLFTKTLKGMTEDVRNKKNNLKFTILGAQTAYAFAKKSYITGTSLVKGMKNRRTPKKIEHLSKNMDEMRKNKGSGLIKKEKIKVKQKKPLQAAKAVQNARLAMMLGRVTTDSVFNSRSKQEEDEKKRERQELINKTVEGKRIAEKFKGKLKDNGFKKAGNSALNKSATSSKKALKKTTKKTAIKAASRTKNAKETGSAIIKLSKSLISLLAKIPIPIWIGIGIFLIILLLCGILKSLVISSAGDSIIKAGNELIGETSKYSESISEAVRNINETTILVSNRLTDDKKYVDIKKYLELLQSLDEEREENAIKFATSPIGSINPESLGLNKNQKNGVIGQNPKVLCEKIISHYGSLDKKNAYTLHYMDAYGNEIANHSTNARDVLSLCAVIFSNYSDKYNAFMFLLEDEWYLLNPKIEWQESEIYCCDTSDAHIEGNTAYYVSCDGALEGEKYKESSEHFWYYCNKKEDTDKVNGYKDAGVKLTGDLRTYDEKGCKKRTESIEFEGDGYDTYDLYIDGYISYDDYLYYADTYSDEYIITGTFYKDVWYCDGHFINCCFGHKDIDLYITLYDKDFAMAENIYPDELTSNTKKYSFYSDYLKAFTDDSAFENEGRIRWVDAIYESDWFDIYGIDVFGGAGFEIGGTLTDADIDSILGNLSKEDLTIIRQAIIEFALKYVGRIPYYFGGKAEYLDYEKNHFYSIVEPDTKGRTRKGLDCSGFVSWVFANKGISIPSSTAGFLGYSVFLDHNSLKVGDLGFLNKPGAENNHIGIYAGVDENGNDLWIHCNASAGNVSVNNYNGFRYYLSLAD